MDLFEYQARDMFEAHGVPVLAGIVADTPEAVRAAAEEIGPKSGGVVVVKAQVKTGGRGKAGGVKVAKSADEAAAAGRADPRHGHQGPHRPPRHGRPGRLDRRGVLLLGPARPRQPHLPRHVLARRAAWRSSSSPWSAPTPSPASRSTPTSASTRPRPARSSTRPVSTRPTSGPSRAVLTKLWDVYREEDATLVEVNPLVKTSDGDDRRPRRQGHPRRERRLPPRGPRRPRGRAQRRPARGGGQGEEPQLRQARRRRRHHRQRRRAGHVDPRRRRVRR